MNAKIEPTESQAHVLRGLRNEGCVVMDVQQNPESRVLYIYAHEADDPEQTFICHVSSLGDVDWSV